MFGILLTARRKKINSIVNSRQFQMLLVSISVGIISGVFIATVRLGIGMPGHKAFFWMTPVLITRLLNKCKIGTTVGGLSAALTTYCLGANLAGGFIGMPMIVLAGTVLDWTVNKLENNQIKGAAMVLALSLAGVAANLICFSKRMILPTGFDPHFFLGVSGFWFKLVSYSFFGLISSIAAITGAKLIRANIHKKKQLNSKVAGTWSFTKNR